MTLALESERRRAGRAGGDGNPGPATYRPEIDGLRAVAVIAVILNHFHKDLLPSGYLGVDVFFVISGYVITASLVSRPANTAAAFLLDFYGRRVKRIIPALLFCVLIGSVLISLFSPEPAESLQTGIASLLGLSNLWLLKEATDYFASSTEMNVFTHTWSLGVEEQFYALYPALFWLCGRGVLTAAGRRRLIALIGGLSLLSVVGFALLYRRDLPAAYFLMPTRFWELGAGCLLFLLQGRPGLAAGIGPRRPGALLPTLAAVGLVLTLLAPQGDSALTTIVVVALSATLIATLGPGSLPWRLLSSPWAVGIGLISYSLYLWHWVVLSLSRWTIGVQGWTVPFQVALMLALALFSYRCIETPLRHSDWGGGSLRPLGAGIGALALALAGLSVLEAQYTAPLYLGRRSHVSGDPPNWKGSIAIAGTEVSGRNCHTDPEIGGVPVDGAYWRRCTTQRNPLVPGVPSAQRLFFVGDSHALAAIPLEEALLAARRDVEIGHFSRSGCPFPATAHGHLAEGCAPFQTRVEEHLLRELRPRDLVFILGYHLSHLGDGRRMRGTRDGFLDAAGRPITNGHQKEKLYMEAVNRVAEQAAARGARVVLIGAFARNPSLRKCRPEWFHPIDRKRCEQAMLRDLGQARELNARLEAALAGSASFFDPLPSLCRRGCDNRWSQQNLRDGHHLRAATAASLRDDLERFLVARGLLPPRGPAPRP